jgi:hypothetical protein
MQDVSFPNATYALVWDWNASNVCLVILVVMLTCKTLFLGSFIGISRQGLYRNGYRYRLEIETTGLLLLGSCIRIYEFWPREMITNPTLRVLLILCLYWHSVY